MLTPAPGEALPPPPSPPGHARDAVVPAGWRRRAALALGAVLAVALVARVLPYSTVFTPDGVLLTSDGDTYYHALRAERIGRDWPRVSWRDAGMNHPYGAEVPWPPLFDELIATAALATGDASPQHVAAVAAVLPVVLGLGVVAVTAWLAALLVGGTGWEAALLMALLLAAVRQSFVGHADHHVLETLLYGLAFVGLSSGLRGRRAWSPAVLLGVALTLAFWNWPGSAMYLLVLGACVATMHVLLPPGDGEVEAAAATLARGALIACGLLAATIPLLGPPGAIEDVKLTPITGLSIALTAMTAGGASVVALARRLQPAAHLPYRLAHLAGAASLPLLATIAAPPAMRAGIVHGAMAVNAGNAWYRSIGQFWPVAFSGAEPWSDELLHTAYAFGLTPLLLLGAVASLARWRPATGSRKGPLVLVVAWAAFALLLAVLRRRFEAYAVLPLALVGAWTVRGLADRLGHHGPRASLLAAVGLVVVAAPSLPVVVTASEAQLPWGAADKLPLLSWLRTQKVMPAREGVLAFWSDGHEIQWFARRPVVSTPFGSDLDARSLAGEVAFITEPDPDAARAVLDARRIGFLLLTNPVSEVATIGQLDPRRRAWAIEERGLSTGRRYALYQEFFDLVVSRLYFFDGGSRSRAPGLSDYRLLGESPTLDDVLGLRSSRYKLFGVASGAVVRVGGLPPGSSLRCATRVATNVGRTFDWASWGNADSSGTAACRVPYATGSNGLVRAEPYVLTTARGGMSVAVPEDAVLDGRVLSVQLPP